VISFTPRPLYHRGKSPRYPLDRSWAGPKGGLDDVEKRKFLTLPGLELRPLCHPARSQSLYRLRFPGSHNRTGIYIKLKSIFRIIIKTVQCRKNPYRSTVEITLNFIFFIWNIVRYIGFEMLTAIMKSYVESQPTFGKHMLTSCLT
jgi:hypothetical protein